MKILPLLAVIIAMPAAAQTTLIEEGRSALFHDKPDAAVQALERATAQTPSRSDAHYWLGRAYGELALKSALVRQFTIAHRTREEFERAVRLDPNNLDARFALVEFYTMAPPLLGGGQGKAFQQANEIKVRDSVLGHRAIALIYEHQRRLDLARSEYLAAVNEHPGSVAAHYYLGVFYLQTDRNFTAAKQQLETAVQIDPEYMLAWFEIGHVAAITGNDLERGDKALQRYLAHKPDDDDPPLSRALYWLGMTYEKRGRHDDAREKYAEALRLDPRQHDAMAALQRLR